ncbi:probable serine/threonine-protein kinase SIS8 isoform X2 [Tripterygium wilfordii]|uniref:probable serine/threonine-protein kinase SIS8 isoform X2 n=1 Tax=Tripterygium wilfordii TaxID=458696 RepID=UPI0018F7E759|nr:probable serine/threonine-protein kinase SIS8 isoform X2 [Tripterygium wilfordii]
MKNLLKKFHMMSNQAEDTEGSPSSRGSKSNETPLSDRFVPSRSHQNPEQKPFSGLSNWFTSVTHRKSPSPPSSSNVTRGEKMEPSDSVSTSGLEVAPEAVTQDSGSSNSRDPDLEEEFQIQMALELSASEDPEAVQIEAVKQISLGSCDPENTPAEVIAYRYWIYNALNYDDKILDGFYDLYGVLTESTSERMPSLIDLQGTPVSGNVTWEAVLVNRAADANLLKLEQKASEMAVKSRLESLVSVSSDLVRKLAVLVSDYMGGPVGDPSNMSRAWRSLSYSLKATLGSMVLPLGSLTIGLARHRALLFKVLADSIVMPCRLVKGQQFTGSDDVAMNFVRVDDGREYIVDLMADPGTLIPSDAAGSHIVFDDLFFSTSPLSRDIDSSRVASSSSGVGSSFEEHSEPGTLERRFRSKNFFPEGNQSEETIEFRNFANLTKPNKGEEGSKTPSDLKQFSTAEKMLVRELPSRPNYPHVHARSPSWTEGVSSPAVLKKKAKDVSQYMIDAAKENPQLAQKLHDVLVESGVVAPPNLFSEIYPEKLDALTYEGKISSQVAYGSKEGTGNQDTKDQDDFGPPRFVPPLPHRVRSKTSPFSNQAEQYKPVEGIGVNLAFDIREGTRQPVISQQSENYVKNVPVAAAAAAAVVASSMVIAVAKANTDPNLPVAAAATATAAAVVATTAAVNKQYEQGIRSDGDADSTGNEPHGSRDQERDALAERERIADRFAGSDSSKSDVTLDDVAEWEILWEDITLGSYGEVYRGDWHGTEVAVKRFLDQDLYGQALEEFRSEVRIMKRVRHPNVVLFMGAVTRAPNLSIVAEFLPRGSLYRLLHRPNNQLDERRRLRMALDAARGMNYLHNCTPVIVHRDLKSPNLLVDRNWVVKVCDFGLSRMKHNTFLSSRSTAGTAEWMAPEVLRNEPSDEKCDVYSFGVILWELCTLQQPWGGLNPMQVVGAVGFQHRRLDIPEYMDPAVAEIIRQCWQTDPKLRPTFAEIMAALKPLQKPITSSQLHRTSASASGHDRGQQSEAAEDLAS